MFRFTTINKILLAPITTAIFYTHHYNVALNDETHSKKSLQMQKELNKFLKNDQIVLNMEERQMRAKAWNSYHKCDTYPLMILYPEW